METTECDRIIFHFNKAHLSDASIPMWTIKHKGQTYYVHHMESSIGFKTKETPENAHTKGSIMFKGKLKIYETNSETTQSVSETHALIF